MQKINKIFEDYKSGELKLLTTVLKEEFNNKFSNPTITDEECVLYAEEIQFQLLVDLLETNMSGNVIYLPELLGEIDNDIFYITNFEANQLTSQRQINFINKVISDNYSNELFVEKDIFSLYEDADFLKSNATDGLDEVFAINELEEYEDDMFEEISFDTALEFAFDEDTEEVRDFIYAEIEGRTIININAKKVKNVWCLEVTHHAGNEMFNTKTTYALAV